MKKVFLSFLVLFFCVFVVWYFVERNSEKIVSSSVRHLSTTPPISSVILPTQKETLLFVPYWTLGNGNIDHSYDTLIYFGVGVNESGIDTSDAGYKGIDTFLQESSARKNFLAIRMVDSNVDTKVLDSPALQKVIISQGVELAKRKGFDGIVLDFEISALAFDSVVKEISGFETSFASSAHLNGLSFSPMMYGDTFYQLRPFDVSSIGNASDRIMVMAYDFHKAGGSPGPNFPLHGKDFYGYDFETMINDFLKHTSVNKVVVIFGMYGYDWQIDAKGQGVGIAKSYSDYEMKQKFLNICGFQNCIVKRDALSSEMHVSYLGSDGKHDVWFEDVSSSTQKINFLESKGINRVGYWAWSYF